VEVKENGKPPLKRANNVGITTTTLRALQDDALHQRSAHGNVAKMACAHAASMAVLSRLGGGHGGDRHVAMMAAAASKLLWAYALQVETFRRLRAGGSQFMRIEHVHIEANAQAVIGNVQNTGEDNEPGRR
jgi:hypothetical protein